MFSDDGYERTDSNKFSRKKLFSLVENSLIFYGEFILLLLCKNLMGGCEVCDKDQVSEQIQPYGKQREDYFDFGSKDGDNGR